MCGGEKYSLKLKQTASMYDLCLTPDIKGLTILYTYSCF